MGGQLYQNLDFSSLWASSWFVIGHSEAWVVKYTPILFSFTLSHNDVNKTKVSTKTLETKCPWYQMDLLARGYWEHILVYLLLSSSYVNFCCVFLCFLTKLAIFLMVWKHEGWKIIFIPLGIANSKMFICWYTFIRVCACIRYKYIVLFGLWRCCMPTTWASKVYCTYIVEMTYKYLQNKHYITIFLLTEMVIDRITVFNAKHSEVVFSKS